MQERELLQWLGHSESYIGLLHGVGNDGERQDKECYSQITFGRCWGPGILQQSRLGTYIMGEDIEGPLECTRGQGWCVQEEGQIEWELYCKVQSDWISSCIPGIIHSVCYMFYNLLLSFLHVDLTCYVVCRHGHTRSYRQLLVELQFGRTMMRCLASWDGPAHIHFPPSCCKETFLTPLGLEHTWTQCIACKQGIGETWFCAINLISLCLVHVVSDFSCTYYIERGEVVLRHTGC